MTKTVEFEGREYEFPDDATDEEIFAMLGREPRAPPQVGQAEDLANSFGAGLRRFGTALSGSFGDLPHIASNAMAAGAHLAGKGQEYTAAAGNVARNIVEGARQLAPPVTPMNAPAMRSTQQVSEGLSRQVGPEYEPQTVAGGYARSAGEFAPAAVFPGGAATRIARATIPAASSEFVGTRPGIQGTPLEGPARLAAGLGGGLAAEAGAAANAARAAARQPRPGVTEDYVPFTQAERSGNPRARQEEDDWRRGIGSERAQRTMQAFDDRRAPEIRDNVMRIATRGKEPSSEDLGAAGTTVSDALRTRHDNMRQEQANLYRQAFDKAQNERVSSNEVADDLMQAVETRMDNEFLDAPGARNVVGRLQAEIAAGRATYATVERARQALNRQLGSAMRAGDDAQTYAIHAVIDEVDNFVAPRLSPDASRAVTEARGFTREMLDYYGQRQRTDLATGHVGRSDPGGRAIEKVLNTDLTGEQVIDAILGAGTKPSQATLGAVRRIREIHDSIQYQNRNAQSGVRVPGRQKVGGQTAGERRMAADSDASRYGVELPKDEMQGLREGLFHRILRPLDARNQGGLIPAQTVVTNLRRALDGPGKEITELLLTERERVAMRRALAELERVIPPSGTAVSGTPVALSRMIAGTFDKLAGIIPGLGPVLREVISEANTSGAARRAVQPPPPAGAPRRAAQYQPSPVGVPLAAASAAQEREKRR